VSFLWTGLLVLLAIVPLAIVFYIILLQRRRRYAVRYSSLSLIREAVSHQTWWRRHIPFILFLLGLTSLVIAMARPVATVLIPSNKATVILAMDVSRSMCATDIPPNRLEAAKDAAQVFIHNHKSGRQIGIVAFAGFAELIQPPTIDTGVLNDAIENLTTARRTAIGSAILRAIDAISAVDDRVASSDNVTASGGIPGLTQSETTEPSPHIIILLTDGASNAGPFPLTAAAQAAARGIRVYTIGYGTVNNTSPMDCSDNFGQDQFFFGGGGGFDFDQQGGGGRGFRLTLDEDTLKQIADITGGTYYFASSASELEEVFQNLPSFVIATRETIEISVFFTAFAGFMILLAMSLSFRWHPLG